MLDLLDQVEQNLTVSKIGIEEFAESDEFCNKPLYPRQKVLLKLIFLEELTGEEEDILDYWIAGGRDGDEIILSPDIRQRVSYLRENDYPHFRECVLVGGRRSSKGFCTGMAMAKVMWDVLQLQDPGRFYGIDPDKAIYFSCVAGSEKQAQQFQYADLVGMVSSCQAFEPYLSKSLETEFRVSTSADLRRMQMQRARGTKLDRDESKLRGNALAANAGTLRGSTTIALCIDEMAHMIPGESKASADEVYKAAEPSLDQFALDGIIFCNSSPYSKVGMFYDRHAEAMLPYNPEYGAGDPLNADGSRVNGNPLSFSFQYPSWALFEGYKKYKSKFQPTHKFREVITASPDWDPEELDEDGTPLFSKLDKAKITSARASEASNPESYKVERRGKFAEVTDAYLSPEQVDKAFSGVPSGIIEGDKIVLVPLKTNWGTGATNLYKYKAHLDPSSTTAGFGFALAHVERHPDPDERIMDHVVFDIVKRWNPKDFPGETIQWPIVIDEVIGYIDLFRPYEVTFDQFQSAEPVQTLKYALMEKGIEGTQVGVKVATLERNWFRAETFKTALNHGLVHAPNDTEDAELASNELKFLQVKNTGGRYPRVDKQDVGPIKTKDIADCMFECVEALIGNVLAQQMRDRAVHAVMSPGAQGGFRIGGQAQPSLAELHPNLAGYYGGMKREGEQRSVGYNTMPYRGVVGAGRRGMNRTRWRSRGR